MVLSETNARQLLDLNPDYGLGLIDKDVAERQFQVVLKGFNFLSQPENNFLYIADEVGLGKTFIAIGIAALLRHFSENPQQYNDVIIVPKMNLQYKWQKEINNFIRNNYLLKDNIVKSVLGKPAAYLGKGNIKNYLSPITKIGPNYTIYRNSSFSIASDSDTNSRKWMDKLKERLPESQQQILEKVFKKFRRSPQIVKRAYAYLLNDSLPLIDFLIVDEAHNFKHGVQGDVSTRNQIVSRFLGACADDDELFEAFPELQNKFQPKVKKLLFLSATPINAELFEIKNQLDCFLANHLFKNIGNEKYTEQFINDNLNKFLIRGLMTINIGDKQYSRNTYRHEHRYGNVIMKENASPQCMSDNKTALVLSLIQFKTIKELKLKSNNQFEMGMLAAFESFESTVSKYEEDTLVNRNANEAKDEQLIKSIVDSYYKEFGEYPPHPKQDSLIDELFDLMLKSRKALVFVRRIASVRELERKLYKKYSDHIISIIKRIKGFKKCPELKKLVEKSEIEKDREDIERILDLLTDRLVRPLKNKIPPGYDNELDSPEQKISSDLRALFNAVIEISEIEKFQQEIKAHVRRKYINSELKELSSKILSDLWNNRIKLEEEIDEENTRIDEDDYVEEKSPYFFQRYFFDEGKLFKKRIYTKDWFEINLLLINKRFNLFEINESRLSYPPDFQNLKNDFRKFTVIRELTFQALRDTDKQLAAIHEAYLSPTFITDLLLDLLINPFTKWIEAHCKLLYDGNHTRFIDELDTLNEILRSIFRQGSGLIPVFIAEALTKSSDDPKASFTIEMKKLLSNEFDFVLNEIQAILEDYDKIIEKNFYDKYKIRYNLIQQLPVLGISGSHKRDVRKTAIQFRMPGYPYILIATDILKEGEDLHTYCKNIYHYGIAWNPSDMEQRTGRIDRIDSLAYKLMKQASQNGLNYLPFESKLQVFYPYLADTLEVNQMAKLFNGMDRFIDIFYNDLSVKMEKDAKAAVDELVTNIKPQKSGLLSSKYDIHNFIGLINGNSEYQPRQPHGPDATSLINEIESLLELLNSRYHFISPEFDRNSFRVTGVMKIRNNRQGPYICSIEQGRELFQFHFKHESCLGRVRTFGSLAVRQKIDFWIMKIKEKYSCELTIEEKNSYVWLQTISPFNMSGNVAFNTLLSLVHLADRIESYFSTDDEKIDNIA